MPPVPYGRTSIIVEFYRTRTADFDVMAKLPTATTWLLLKVAGNCQFRKKRLTCGKILGKQ
jgi:hypothetical protein